MTKEIKKIVIESTWASSRGGWGNGYLALPKGHKMYGMNYNDIHAVYDISVHGGLTFSESGEYVSWAKENGVEDCWIIGFDTQHSHDNLERWPDELSVMKECDSLLFQVEKATFNLDLFKHELNELLTRFNML